MEEAYSELYQQFLHLRSLCLRQAALLHQLTKALQKQQGTNAPNEELSDMMSIPVQCTQEIPVYFHEKPKPAAGAAAQSGVNRVTRNMETFSDLLTEDMSKLCMGVPHQRQELEQKLSPLLTMDYSMQQGSSCFESKTAGKANNPSRGRTVRSMRMPVSDGPPAPGDLLSESSGLLMSEVALQSHVCDFCQAVFPGDTTTRGEYLRHLHTHIT